MDPLLEGNLGLSLVGRRGQTVQLMTLLLQDQLGARCAGCRDQRERSNLSLSSRGEQPDPAPLTVTDHGDPVPVHVLPVVQVANDLAEIRGVVVQVGRLGATAAQTDPPFVVTKHQIAGIRQRAGELTEDRDPGDGLVAVDLTRPPDEHDRRPAAIRRGLPSDGRRQRCGQTEAG